MTQMKLGVPTDECTPDSFKVSISAVVRGCTTLSSLINSFVASVNSDMHGSTWNAKSSAMVRTQFLYCVGRQLVQFLVHDLICQPIRVPNKLICVK